MKVDELKRMKQGESSLYSSHMTPNSHTLHNFLSYNLLIHAKKVIRPYYVIIERIFILQITLTILKIDNHKATNSFVHNVMQYNVQPTKQPIVRTTNVQANILWGN
ncbi:hypothetical protein O6H91_Y169200 [Diphasiastrum complanatum]|nr:hypothetical protein O6H91_Y169200 [Diphasiastrum complanatum]